MKERLDTFMEDKRTPLDWYIAVPKASRGNFERALKASTWGAKQRRQFMDATVGELSLGDTVHFILGPRWDGEGPSPSGFPRIPLDQYTVWADEIIGKVMSPVYQEDNPIWDDDVYPIRFRFSVESTNTGVRLTPDTVSDTIRDATRRSLIAQGRAIPVAGKVFSLNDALRQVFEQFPDARRQPFPDHPVARLIKQQIPIGLQQVMDLRDDRYVVLSSVGQGNWATVPWVAIMDRQRGGSIQDGLYVAFLFGAEMDRVVLALMFGVTGSSDIPAKANRQGLAGRIQNLRRRLRLGGTTWRLDNDLKLADKGVGSQYGRGIVLYRTYAANALPSDQEWTRDLREILNLYQKSFDFMNSDMPTYPLKAPDEAVLAKDPPAPYKVPFNLYEAHSRVASMGYQIAIEDLLNVLLCIEVRPFVIFSGKSGTGKTTLSRIIANLFDWHYESVAVSPAWADPADLLGFISPINQQRVDGALSALLGQRYDEALLCLDEFNIAKVEHYFSDFISAMDGGGTKGFWGPLAGLQRLTDQGDPLTLPRRLNVVATMNFDDSVQSITPRVLDRANVVEFDIARSDDLIVGNAIDWSPHEQEAPFQWPWARAENPKDELSEEIIRKLWQSLRSSRGQFGHRVAQEIHQYVAIGLPFAQVLGRTTEQQRQGLLDRQIVQRLLPKFHGTASSRDIEALMQLLAVLMESGGASEVAADRQALIDETINSGWYPRTALKVNQLFNSYTEDGYASFW